MSFRSDQSKISEKFPMEIPYHLSKIIKNGKKFSIFDNYKYSGTVQVVPVHSIIQIYEVQVHTQVDKGHHV